MTKKIILSVLLMVLVIIQPSLSSASTKFLTPDFVKGLPSTCHSAKTLVRHGGVGLDGLAKRYGLEGLYAKGDLGQDKTIALVEYEPVIYSDIVTFDDCYFWRSGGYKDHVGKFKAVMVDGGPNSPPQGEAEVDIEVIQALAPDANVVVFTAPNTPRGSLDALKAVEKSKIPLVSYSWSLCEAVTKTVTGYLKTEQGIIAQMTANGQSIFAASGDSGSAACFSSGVSELAVNDPASQPQVIGVGGTTFSYGGEATWNNGILVDLGGGASGGGFSDVWSKPSWQSAPGIDNVYSELSKFRTCGGPCREVPDVSGFADPGEGLTLYISGLGGWLDIGGTSIAAPTWASGISDLSCNVGWVLPKLYKIASGKGYSEAFRNIVLGDNDMGLNGGLFPASKGYNLATGLGSPKFGGLEKELCSGQ